MKKELTNYAFIDSQNLNLGIQKLGWKLDFLKFRTYLKEKYAVHTAYLFMGYMPDNQDLYKQLKEFGYTVIFKPVLESKAGGIKGNCDAELVLQAMIDYRRYKKAIIVTSDGDFHCLVKHLYKENKLERVLSPCEIHCSALLKKAAIEKIYFMSNMKKKLEYIKKSAAEKRKPSTQSKRLSTEYNKVNSKKTKSQITRKRTQRSTSAYNKSGPQRQTNQKNRPQTQAKKPATTNPPSPRLRRTGNQQRTTRNKRSQQSDQSSFAKTTENKQQTTNNPPSPRLRRTDNQQRQSFRHKKNTA